MKHVLFIPCLLFALHANAQGGHFKDTAINGQTFTYVDEMPSAGYDYNKYISDNIHYPDSARARNIEGRVVLRFVVNEDGAISDCVIVKSVNSYLDEEALRVVRSFLSGNREKEMVSQ